MHLQTEGHRAAIGGARIFSDMYFLTTGTAWALPRR